jgi:hypothetical protein
MPDDDALSFFVKGDTDPESLEHAGVVAKIGSKLSRSLPTENGCILDLFQDSLRKYSRVENGRPFLHRFITGSGNRLSSSGLECPIFCTSWLVSLAQRAG